MRLISKLNFARNSGIKLPVSIDSCSQVQLCRPTSTEHIAGCYHAEDATQFPASADTNRDVVRWRKVTWTGKRDRSHQQSASAQYYVTRKQRRISIQRFETLSQARRPLRPEIKYQQDKQ